MVDPLGVPQAGISVWIADPTFLPDPKNGFSVESFLGREDQDTIATTDALGRFRIPALTDREYALRCAGPGVWAEANVRAGIPLAPIALRPSQDAAVLRGRLVDGDGEPASDALVQLIEVRSCTSLGSDFFRRDATELASMRSSPSGHFRFEAVPQGANLLRVVEQGLVLGEFPLPPATETDSLFHVRKPRELRLSHLGEEKLWISFHAGHGEPALPIGARFRSLAITHPPSRRLAWNGEDERRVTIPSDAEQMVVRDAEGRYLYTKSLSGD